MASRSTRRGLVAAALAATLTIPAVARATGGPSPDRPSRPAKTGVSPALAALVAHGYGSFDIASVVPDHVPGHVYYLAHLATPVDERVERALAAAGARVRLRFPEIGWVALSSPPAAVSAVARVPGVTRLEVDRVLTVEAVRTAAVSIPGVADQSKRGPGDVGADALWAAGITGRGVRVGVADTGVDESHPDLDDLDWRTWQRSGHLPKVAGFVDCSAVAEARAPGGCQPLPQGYDDNGHGTHVSGIATGTAEGGSADQRGVFPGMAPDAELAVAKVCSPAGTCLNSAVMAGLRWLADDSAGAADVINVSLGSGRFYGAPFFGAEQVTNDDPEAQLVNWLARKFNVVFTISAGNSGPVLQSTGSPAVASQAIAVGASVSDFDLDHPADQTVHGDFGNVAPAAPAAGATGIATFSSRGPTGDRLIKPELTAPGVYVVAPQSSEGAEVTAGDVGHMHKYSADQTYAVLSGTSMSAPSAAGVAALLIDGYRRAAEGRSPAYWEVKAAMANTAGTDAFEGPVAGLIGGIRSKLGLSSPEELYPARNRAWVGTTGEGAGRVNAPAALLALTHGVTILTPESGDPADVHARQPNWALDDVAPGERRTQRFVIHPGANFAGAKVSLAPEDPREPNGVFGIPKSWFVALPKPFTVAPGRDTPFEVRLRVPADAAPGTYGGSLLATVDLGGGVRQRVRIPVQLFVPLPIGGSVTAPIWASEPTDYSLVGFENPLGDVFTDWMAYPLRIPAGSGPITLSVYDTATDDADHMDIFVFDAAGQEVDSSVTFFTDHAVPGGVAYAPSTSEDPTTVTLLDGDDLQDLELPTTVWVMVSDSSRPEPGFRTFRLSAVAEERASVSATVGDSSLLGDAGGLVARAGKGTPLEGLDPSLDPERLADRARRLRGGVGGG
jgi:subtilisin family serine protease